MFFDDTSKGLRFILSAAASIAITEEFNRAYSVIDSASPIVPPLACANIAPVLTAPSTKNSPASTPLISSNELSTSDFDIVGVTKSTIAAEARAMLDSINRPIVPFASFDVDATVPTTASLPSLFTRFSTIFKTLSVE